MPDITMQEMLEAGVHFGHQTRRWHPAIAPYLYGEFNNIHIFNLEHALPMLRQAMAFAKSLGSNKKQLLFVGTKHAARRIVEKAASDCKMPYVDKRWLGGTLTNFATIRRSVKRLDDIDALLGGDSTASQIKKKEKLQLEREQGRLIYNLAGIREMVRLPDALFVIDTGMERIAILEARKLRIPVIAIVDSNQSPLGIDYPIPGNDDARRAIQLYADAISKAIQQGHEQQVKGPSESDDYVAIEEVATEATDKEAATSDSEPAAKPAKASPSKAATSDSEPAAKPAKASPSKAATSDSEPAAKPAKASPSKAATSDSEPAAKPAKASPSKAATSDSEPAAKPAKASPSKAATSDSEPAAKPAKASPSKAATSDSEPAAKPAKASPSKATTSDSEPAAKPAKASPSKAATSDSEPAAKPAKASPSKATTSDSEPAAKPAKASPSKAATSDSEPAAKPAKASPSKAATSDSKPAAKPAKASPSKAATSDSEPAAKPAKASPSKAATSDSEPAAKKPAQ